VRRWNKFIYTHLYHSRQLYNIHLAYKKLSDRAWLSVWSKL